MSIRWMTGAIWLGLTLSLSAQTSWTVGRTNLAGVNFAQNIAFGNGRFVVTLAGSGGAPGVAWSTDGLTWRGSATPMISQGTVLFAAGVFYFAGSGGVWRSADGDTWQQIYAATGSLTAYRGLASNGRGLLAGSANGAAKSLLYSPDFVSFRQTADLPGTNVAGASVGYGDIVYALGRYYVAYFVSAPSTGGALLRYVAATVDGTEWTTATGPLASASWLAAGNGRLLGVVFGSTGTTAVMTTDGVTFSTAPVPGGITNGGNLAFGGGRFFFAGSLQASFDGRTWAPLAPVSFPGIPQMNAVAYGNGRYVAVGYGSGADIIATLEAAAPPIVASAPTDRVVAEGARVVFTVTVSNPTTRTSFQWRRDGALIAGATNPSFELASVRTSDAGGYSVDLRNDVGATSTEPAQLQVVPAAEAGRIINLSVLTTLDNSSALLSAGYVIGGAGTTGSKPLLVRAGGPSLVRFGVTSANPDPVLETYTGVIRDGESDNWGGAALVSDVSARVGAFPFLAADSKDAALFVPSMPRGDHTVRVTGKNGATGAVLAEIYDATPADLYTATTPRLVNVSVLKSVPAGTTITAGFVIGGRTNVTVLVRAIGPALAAFGLPVASLMADPRLAVYREGTSTPIASNDNWGGSTETEATMAAVGAFALPSPTSKDAALVLTLPPGNYTAQVAADSAGGNTLVEIYEVP